MKFEQSSQQGQAKKMEAHHVMAGRWVNGQFVEGSIGDTGRDASQDKPAEKKVEIDPSLAAANKLEQDVSASQERLAQEKARLKSVTEGGAGAATLFGVPGEKFIASGKIKMENAERNVAQAEHGLNVNRTAHEALASTGTIEGAVALMDAKEADMAKKIGKMFKMLEYAKTNGLDPSKLEEERGKLAGYMQTFADAREKLKGLG